MVKILVGVSLLLQIFQVSYYDLKMLIKVFTYELKYFSILAKLK